MIISDAEIASLSPNMQEAVRFVQFWNMASSMPEFIAAMDWPLERKSWAKASQLATKLRKGGVPLRKLKEKAADLNWSYLQILAERSMAQLTLKKDEAERVAGDIQAMRSEAHRILTELRKFKNKAVAYEAMLAEGD